MLRNVKFLLTLALAACALSAYADPPGRVGRVNYAAGAVSFAPAEAPDQWTGAVLNRPLTAGDRLWADRDGRAELHVGSTAIRMAANTNLDVLNLNDDTLQFRLAQGAANVRVRALDPGDTVEIATPGGAVVVRQPGSYRVSVDPQDGTSRVVVNFGQADVVTPTQRFTVPSSQAAVIPIGENPSFEVVAHASGDEFDRWAAERDRREDRSPSTQYVSRQMTGYEDLDHYGSWRTLPEYGAVWVPAAVAPGWAPYRAGHWVWVAPWGWTWVDDAPWGFAPFHYGRWVHTGGYWAWAPGAIVRRPVYAPALVAFVGGPRASFTLSVGSGPAVGWFPLGWRDPYIPSYRASPAYVRNVNVTHVTNVTNVTNIYNNPGTVNNVNFANRNNPQALTVVPQQAFVSARPVAQAAVRVSQAELARTEVIQSRQPAEPVRASIASERPGNRPPATATSREVFAVNAPAAPAAQASFAAPEGTPRPARAEHDPRVRVIGSRRDDARAADKGAPQGAPPDSAAPAGVSTPTPAARPSVAAPAARAPEKAAPAQASPAARAPEAAPVQASPAARAPEAAAAKAPAREGPRDRRQADDTAKSTPREVPIAPRTPDDAMKGPPRHAPPAPRVTDDTASSKGPQRAAPAAREPRATPQEAAPKPPAERREPRRERPAKSEPQAEQRIGNDRLQQRADNAPPPRETVRAQPPQPQAPREAARPAAPPPQAHREAPRPQQAQVPRAPAPQPEERERGERRRGGGPS